MLKILLLVGTGGFLGSISRFGMSLYVQKWFNSAFPYGTFFVNLLGCFIIGLLYGLSSKSHINPEFRFFLAVGFCGGFTTFSTFSYESLTLLRDNNYLFFALYTGFSVVLGILATLLGNNIVK